MTVGRRGGKVRDFMGERRGACGLFFFARSAAVEDVVF
jgi:hypothetical protein